MSKTLRIALREFVATVRTTGFLIGILLTPVLVVVTVAVMQSLAMKPAPRVEGEVAIADATGVVAEGLRAYLDPQAMATRRRAKARELDRQASALRRGRSISDDPADMRALDALLGQVPRLTIASLPADADMEREKELLRLGEGRDGGRLMLVAVDANAVIPAAGSTEYGSYDLFAREKLDDRIEDEIAKGLQEAIISARVRAAGLNRERIDAMTHVTRRASMTVTKTGDRQTNKALNVLLPMGFMVLLLISVMMAGQYLLTATVEEKATRVVEVLLSAVSPMQIMTGKILGYMAVGLLILLLYGGMGIVWLVSFAMQGLIDPGLLLYTPIFFLIAYFTVAALMAAVGAATNEMREAQALMTPVTLLVALPAILWLPISRAPNGALAVTLSFVPPTGSFVTLLRMASTTPPPPWQVWASIAVGLGGACAALWAAAKVFRIGLLMYGRPPDLRTLVRWVWMA
jgi:ABC-2 type transport system permease protein